MEAPCIILSLKVNRIFFAKFTNLPYENPFILNVHAMQIPRGIFSSKITFFYIKSIRMPHSSKTLCISSNFVFPNNHVFREIYILWILPYFHNTIWHINRYNKDIISVILNRLSSLCHHWERLMGNFNSWSFWCLVIIFSFLSRSTI